MHHSSVIRLKYCDANCANCKCSDRNLHTEYEPCFKEVNMHTEYEPCHKEVYNLLSEFLNSSSFLWIATASPRLFSVSNYLSISKYFMGLVNSSLCFLLSRFSVPTRPHFLPSLFWTKTQPGTSNASLCLCRCQHFIVKIKNI